ncbi:MAG: peptidoglycan amidohydrolase family protein, partial [Lachnospiraceae bacterium]
NDSRHGYDQARRWGPDYDCSSAIITALKNAGFDVGGSTYTGNMSSQLCARGFVRLPIGTSKQRGDILLNDVNHVALHIGNGQLAEFSINEKGGITGGQVGDQTGRESRVRSYYDYPWNCVLRYRGNQTAPIPPSSSSSGIDVYYAVMLKDGARLPFVKNREDYAGIVGKEIVGLAVKVSAGSIEYQVHTQATGWMSKVTGCDFNDINNGYAGDGKNAIDMIRIYLHSPDGTRCIYYRVAPLNSDYYSYQRDTDKEVGMDGFAGAPNRLIDCIQMYVS